MCLIVFGINVHPKYKLILAGNRDEFYTRPTAQAAFWEDQTQILGGRDLKAGGTWLAVNRSGRFSAVTNYRDLKNLRDDARSRGELPLGVLNEKSIPEFFEYVKTRASDYNGFNLLGWDGKKMLHFSNYEGEINPLQKGIHGLSNALLDTPWPKVEKLKKEFEKVIQSEFEHPDLLEILDDTELAPDNDLPDTGVGYDMEKSLSAMCIRMEHYGTCCSTILTIDRENRLAFTERSYPVGGRKGGDVHYSFQIHG